MLTEVKKELKIAGMSIKYNIMRQMINKFTFISNIVLMMLNNATFIIQWIILFNLKSNIGNYSFREVLILWGLAASTFGISRIIGYKSIKLPELIINGEIDTFLVQPKNVLISIITSDTSISAIGDVLYGIFMLIIYKPTFLQALLFIIFSITGGLILISIAIIFGSLSFWIVKNELANSMNSAITHFATYPEGIFKTGVKILFYTIIPVEFSNFIPLSVIFKFDLLRLLLVLIFTIFIIALSFIIFYKGLKRYSSGNLMNARN